jgi:RNA polymerase sigma-70 factor (ECF subfamily)
MADRKKEELAKRKAFEIEALPHMDALLRTALRMTKNESDAEDLVQETYVKAYRFWDKFELGSNCRAWLFKIMTNIFINDYRSKSRSPMALNVDEIDDNFLYGQLATVGSGGVLLPGDCRNRRPATGHRKIALTSRSKTTAERTV